MPNKINYNLLILSIIKFMFKISPVVPKMSLIAVSSKPGSNLGLCTTSGFYGT